MSDSASSREWRDAFPVVDRLLQLPTQERQRELQALQQQRPDLHEQVLTLIQATIQADSLLSGDTEPGSVAESDMRPGMTLGPYSIERCIGRGGMGEVWLAQRSDGLYEGQVAIKMLYAHLARPGIRERFTREGQILAKLTHPNIARLLDAGISGGMMYLVLEYVPGQRIDQWCREQQFDVAARLRLFLDVCDAVAHAHSHLVVHRDLKPSNILVDAQGRVKLLDFGIAKLLEGTPDPAGGDESELTRLGGRLLTPEYAAPEQIVSGSITTVTDVYALGVLLYELLSGSRPYGGAGAAQLEQAVLHTDPRPPSYTARTRELSEEKEAGGANARLARTLHGDLDNICLMALRKAPEQRYPSVLALRNDLQRYLDHEPVMARGAPFGYRAGKFVRRHRLGVGIAAAGVALIAAGVTGTAWQARSATRAEQAEHRQRQLVEAREAELQQVVDFQSAMLKRVDTQQLGNGWLDRMREHIATHLEKNKPLAPAEAQRVHADFDLMRPWSQPTEVARVSLGTYLLGPAEKEVGGRFDKQPGVEASLRLSLARAYSNIGLYPEGLAQNQRAVELRRQQYGADAPQTLEAMFNLAILQKESSDLKGAIQTATTVYDARTRLLGPDHPDTIRAGAALGNYEYESSDINHAKALLEPLLAKAQRIFGPEDPDTLLIELGLANTIGEAGDWTAADPMFRHVYEARTRVLGPDDANTLGALQMYASDKLALDQEVQARPLMELLVARRRQLLGDRHPYTVEAIGDLANVVSALGDLRQANQLKRETLQTLTSLLGQDSLPVSIAATNYALGLVDAGEADAARPLMEQVVALRTRLLGADNPRTLYAKNNLARVLGAQKQYDAALLLSQQTLETQRRVLGPDKPATLETWRVYGETLHQAHRDAEALKELQPALQALQSANPEGGLDVAAIQTDLATVQDRLGHTAEALDLLQAARQYEIKVEPDDAMQPMQTRAVLIQVLHDAHRDEEARKAGTAVLDDLQRQLGSAQPDTLQVTATLVAVDSALGRDDEARALRARLAAARKPVHSPPPGPTATPPAAGA